MGPESVAIFIPVRRRSINCSAWSIVINQVTRNFVASKDPMFTASEIWRLDIAER
jgi:hypothetical protein